VAGLPLDPTGFSPRRTKFDAVGGTTVTTQPIYQNSQGSANFNPDFSSLPNVGGPFTLGISTDGVYADSTAGNIFQLAAYVNNTGSRATVAVFGFGKGNHVWGGNLIGYTQATGDTAIGLEIDVGNVGGATQSSGAATGLVIVEESGNISGSPSNTAAGLQIQGHDSNSGFASAIRIQANAIDSTNGVGLLYQAVSASAGIGMYFNSSTFATGISFTNGTYTRGIYFNNPTITTGIDFGATGYTQALNFSQITSGVAIKWAPGSTGAGSAALGANCPAVTVSAPYTWIKHLASDGSTVYTPAWK
jgi:hypothetical protein